MANWQNLFQSGEQLSPTAVAQLTALDAAVVAANTAATTVNTGAGAPSGAPTNGCPIYLNSSASFDAYVWTGSAWKGPYKVT